MFYQNCYLFEYKLRMTTLNEGDDDDDRSRTLAPRSRKSDCD